MTFREFETDHSCGMEDALLMIRAALSDEGLALAPRTGRLDEVTSVISNGHKVFRVPESRIISPEEDRALRASLVPEDRR